MNSNIFLPENQSAVKCIDVSTLKTDFMQLFIQPVFTEHPLCTGLPRWLSGKESAGQAGDMGSIPGSARSPGVGNGNPLQYSCLENPMNRGAWQATVHGLQRVRHDWMTEHPHTHTHCILAIMLGPVRVVNMRWCRIAVLKLLYVP